MTGGCPDCGRPYAADGCTGCHRSKRGGWPVGQPVGNGRGGPGLARASPGGRVHQMSFRLDVVMAERLQRTATEQGCAIGRLVRELVDEALRARTGRPPPRPFDPGDPDDVDDALPAWGPVVDGPCDCHVHSPVVASDSRICHDEAEHVCGLHGGAGRRCPRCKRIAHNVQSV